MRADPPAGRTLHQYDFRPPAYAQLAGPLPTPRSSRRWRRAPRREHHLAGAATAPKWALSADKNPIRAQALLLKLQEFMPANLTPVIVDVTLDDRGAKQCQRPWPISIAREACTPGVVAQQGRVLLDRASTTCRTSSSRAWPPMFRHRRPSGTPQTMGSGSARPHHAEPGLLEPA